MNQLPTWFPLVASMGSVAIGTTAAYWYTNAPHHQAPPTPDAAMPTTRNASMLRTKPAAVSTQAATAATTTPTTTATTTAKAEATTTPSVESSHSSKAHQDASSLFANEKVGAWESLWNAGQNFMHGMLSSFTAEPWDEHVARFQKGKPDTPHPSVMSVSVAKEGKRKSPNDNNNNNNRSSTGPQEFHGHNIVQGEGEEKTKEDEPPMITTEFAVKMSCENCMQSVREAVRKLSSPGPVHIDELSLEKQTLVVSGEMLSPTEVLGKLLQTGRDARIVAISSPSFATKTKDSSSALSSNATKTADSSTLTNSTLTPPAEKGSAIENTSCVVEFKGKMYGHGSIRGVIRIVQLDMDTCFTECEVDGLDPTKTYSIAVHEFGDLRDQGDKIGSVYHDYQALPNVQPSTTSATTVGKELDSSRSMQDLSGTLAHDVVPDKHGKIRFVNIKKHLAVWNIIGRAVAIHEHEQVHEREQEQVHEREQEQVHEREQEYEQVHKHEHPDQSGERLREEKRTSSMSNTNAEASRTMNIRIPSPQEKKPKAAAVVARSAAVGANEKRLCTCDGTLIWESA